MECEVKLILIERFVSNTVFISSWALTRGVAREYNNLFEARGIHETRPQAKTLARVKETFLDRRLSYPWRAAISLGIPQGFVSYECGHIQIVKCQNWSIYDIHLNQAYEYSRKIPRHRKISQITRLNRISTILRRVYCADAGKKTHIIHIRSGINELSVMDLAITMTGLRTNSQNGNISLVVRGYHDRIAHHIRLRRNAILVRIFVTV